MPRGKPAYVLMGIVALAAALRFAALGSKSVWSDEALVVWLARADWKDLPRLLMGDVHPPLYELFMKAWIGAFGSSEAAIRFPSACFSTLSVALTYFLVRRGSPEPVALLSAALVAFSPLQVTVGQEARMHTLVGTLVLASTLALAASVEGDKAPRWGVYALLSALAVYTQYLAILVLLAHGLWIAGFHRRSGGRWLASVAAAAALCAPWGIAAWHQGHSLGAWPDNTAYRNPLDLLGLYAVGGSLFGMGSYFFPGTLAPVPELLILLPFCAVLACGVRAMAGDRRGLALLGLPLAVTIGLPLAVSFIKPLFYPRWFSFLFPFYAALFARGVVELGIKAGGSVRARQAAGAAVLVFALLVNVPMLVRYYGDPALRPFQWRAAANLLDRYARPDDFILYSNPAAEVSLTYYFRRPLASLTLTPVEWRRPEAARFTESTARHLASRYARVWFVVTLPFTPAMRERLVPALARAFSIVGAADFNQAQLFLLAPRMGAR